MFAPIRDFIVLMRTAESTRWPGGSRWAFRILVLAGFNTIALLSINIALYVYLIRLGTSAVCRDTSGSFTEVHPLPVTYTTTFFDSTPHTTYLSIHAKWEKSTLIFSCFLFPPMLLVVILGQIALHFKRLTNREGVYIAFGSFIMFIFQFWNNHFVTVDTHRIHTDYARCWTTPVLMKVLLSQARGRRGLVVAAQVLGGVGVVCSVAYFNLAVLAALLNRSATRVQDVRMQNLRHDSGAHPVPANEPAEDVRAENASEEAGRPVDESWEIVPPANAPEEAVVPVAGAKQEEGVIRAPREVHVNPFADPEREGGMGGEWEENVLRIGTTTRRAQRWDLFA